MCEERKNVWEIVGGALVSLVFGVLMAVVLIEWVAGCGETTWIDAYTEVQNQCVIMTWHND